MATSNTFLLNIKHDFIENRKPILLSVSSLWGACVLIGGLLGYYGRGGGFTELFFFTVLLATCGYAFASLMFANMKRKESRIAMLMLPSSMMEKFLTRWIAFVPVLFGILVAGFYLGDASRVLVNSFTNNYYEHGIYSQIMNPWKIAYGRYHMSGSIIFSILSSYFFYQSLFIFGAILWPKLSFIKTLGALWVLQTIVGIIGISIDSNMITTPQDLNRAFVWSGIVLILLTIGMYALSYIRFKKSQVIYKLF